MWFLEFNWYPSRIELSWFSSGGRTYSGRKFAKQYIFSVGDNK